jgi:hypothetical protein
LNCCDLLARVHYSHDAEQRRESCHNKGASIEPSLITAASERCRIVVRMRMDQAHNLFQAYLDKHPALRHTQFKAPCGKHIPPYAAWCWSPRKWST